jgi:hypothetical protein
MVPDWISTESWEAFCDMRKSMKHPLEPYAAKLIVVELCRLKAAGENPQACLDQSIRNGWRDVFRERDKDLGRRHTSAAESQAYLAEQAAVKVEPPNADIMRLVRGTVRSA